MKNPVIDTLVDNLEPKKPLRNLDLWAFYIACMALFAVGVVSTVGIRADLQTAIETASIFWKPAIFLLASLSGLYAMNSLSRPHGQLKTITLMPLVFSAGLIAWQLISQFPNLSLEHISASIGMSSSHGCLLTVSFGGLFLFFAFFKFWLGKTASSRPVMLGAITGFTSATIAATGYSIHCEKDMMMYIIGFYGLGIVAMTLLGAVMGKKLLKW